MLKTRSHDSRVCLFVSLFWLRKNCDIFFAGKVIDGLLVMRKIEVYHAYSCISVWYSPFVAYWAWTKTMTILKIHWQILAEVAHGWPGNGRGNYDSFSWGQISFGILESTELFRIWKTSGGACHSCVLFTVCTTSEKVFEKKFGVRFHIIS